LFYARIKLIFLIDSFFSLWQEPWTDYAISMRDPESSMGFQHPSAAKIERQLSDFQYRERWRPKGKQWCAPQGR
jgi:hypothetical protein